MTAYHDEHENLLSMSDTDALEPSTLLACPLCGGVAKIHSKDQSTTIRCMDGNCEISLTRFRWNASHRAAAILAWNRRAHPPADDRVAVIEAAAMAYEKGNDGEREWIVDRYVADAIRALSSVHPATRQTVEGPNDKIDRVCAALTDAGLGAGEVACDDCGEPYASPRFPDLVLPHDVWKVIAPNDGMLCPNCICARLEKAGLSEVPSKFTSGPLALPPPPSQHREKASE